MFLAVLFNHQEDLDHLDSEVKESANNRLELSHGAVGVPVAGVQPLPAAKG